MNITEGEIVIELDGSPVTLSPTPAAIISISRQCEGLSNAVRRLGNLEVEAFSIVIGAGMKANDSVRKKLPEQIYRSSMLDLMGPCIRFVNILANGGKPLDDGDKEGKDEGN